MYTQFKSIYAPFFLWLGSLAGIAFTNIALANKNDSAIIEEVYIWAENRDSSDADYINPTSILTQQDMQAINMVTTEDLVKFEPSLVIRRRFIGDSNGTLGIRGSNMFQTSRSMVFADGVPLHYLLQSRWNGAPRWTMVSASEIAQVEVIYGPFSAEYSGNAMGGVVLIETAIPQKREFHVDGSFFNQQFDAYGFDDDVDGFKGFISFGDKIGNTSYYFSYNHLDNTAQPQTFRDATFADTPEVGNTSGAIFEKDSRGRSRIWYGDTGTVETQTDNFKFKLGTDFGAWQTLLNFALEDRQSDNVGQSYLNDGNDLTLWAGSELVQDGRIFSINSTRLNARALDRQSLSIGLRLKGQLNDQARFEANVNRFDILKNESRDSALNPQDPLYTTEGQVSDYDDSGWNTAEAKLYFEQLFVPGFNIVTGARYESYELNLDVFDSPNYLTGAKGNYSSRFGGQTQISAVFAQANWTLTPRWDLAFGLRYESFKSHDGYYDDDDNTTPEFDLVNIPSESKDAVSPKFSAGYRPYESWLIRYSAAKAFRFPIVEELFSQYRAYNIVALSNPELEPEDGLHHNIMIDKAIDGGNLRVNLFQETVKDTIESQTDSSTNVRSFVPIDEIDVKGIEFIANKSEVFFKELDLRFNVTWTDAKVVDNSTAESAIGFDPANSIEGNRYPRLPKWRSNLLATYHLNEAFNFSSNIQYTSDSFGRIDNSDTQHNVYGAQDAYTRIGLRAAYDVSNQWNISAGLDNVTNEITYVAHPWPGRTVYLNFSYDL